MKGNRISPVITNHMHVSAMNLMPRWLSSWGFSFLETIQ